MVIMNNQPRGYKGIGAITDVLLSTGTKKWLDSVDPRIIDTVNRVDSYVGFPAAVVIALVGLKWLLR